MMPSIKKFAPVDASHLTAIRAFNPTDANRVLAALWFLDRLYPQGQAWLEKRLNKCNGISARCWLAETGGKLSGIAVETSKGLRRTKLSTLYVLPSFRRRRVASALLNYLALTWRRREQIEVAVTVAAATEPALRPSLLAAGFGWIGTERARYGPERDEAIYQWLNR